MCSHDLKNIKEKGIVKEVVIRIVIQPDKRREMVQTIQELIGPLKKQKGCVSLHFYQDFEDNNSFCFIGQWASQSDIEEHFMSRRFAAMLGAIDILSLSPPAITINEVNHEDGLNTIKVIRGENQDIVFFK
jgi:quinol monooxygenase YgiN